MLSRPPARLASSTRAADRLLHRVGAGEDEADPLLVDHRRQPVRAEQEDVARGRRDGLDVDLDLRLGAEGPGDDRALGVVLGLGVGDLALAPHLLDQRVVAGEAFDLPPAQPVGAAVADVADADLLVGGVDDRGGDRRPHPGQGGVVVRELVDLPVRGLDRRPQERLRAPVGEVAVEGVGRGPRGDLAGLGATHPVGDDEDRRPDEERVLVGAPLAAGVGSECLVVDPEHQRHPASNLKAVSPILTTSPSIICASPVRLASLRRVPLVEFMSSM